MLNNFFKTINGYLVGYHIKDDKPVLTINIEEPGTPVGIVLPWPNKGLLMDDKFYGTHSITVPTMIIARKWPNRFKPKIDPHTIDSYPKKTVSKCTICKSRADWKSKVYTLTTQYRILDFCVKCAKKAPPLYTKNRKCIICHKYGADTRLYSDVWSSNSYYARYKGNGINSVQANIHKACTDTDFAQIGVKIRDQDPKFLTIKLT